MVKISFFLYSLTEILCPRIYYIWSIGKELQVKNSAYINATPSSTNYYPLNKTHGTRKLVPFIFKTVPKSEKVATCQIPQRFASCYITIHCTRESLTWIYDSLRNNPTNKMTSVSTPRHEKIRKICAILFAISHTSPIWHILNRINTVTWRVDKFWKTLQNLAYSQIYLTLGKVHLVKK